MSNPSDLLPARETAALRSLAAVAGSLGVPLLLIGAVARQLVFDCAYALPTRRTTRDLDFGVQVPDWSTFLRLREAAINSGHFAATTRPHALIHQATNLPIDTHIRTPQAFLYCLFRQATAQATRRGKPR